MTPEEIWRSKTDEEVLAAMERLDEFTEIGQRIISDEFVRRQLNSKEAISSSALNVGVIEPVVAGPAFTSHNPIVRLWRGELSLPTSYWLCGLAGNVTWAVLIEVIGRATLSIALVSALTLAHFCYAVVVLVGVWRSAARYQGNRIWADLARFAIAMSILRFFVELFQLR